MIDFDRLAHALGYPHPHVAWTEAPDHPAVETAYRLRASALRHVGRLPRGTTVWLVQTDPTRVPAGVDNTVHVWQSPEECARRAIADGRPDGTLEQINGWFAQHAPSRRW